MHDDLCPNKGGQIIPGTTCGYCVLIADTKAWVREQLLEAWRRDNHAVRFNHAGDDLTPAQRIAKWLRTVEI